MDIAGLQDLGAVEPTFRFQVPHVYSKHLQSPKIDAAWLRKHHKSRTLSNYGPIFLDPHADLPGETPCCLTKHLLPQILRIYKVWASMYISVTVAIVIWWPLRQAVSFPEAAGNFASKASFIQSFIDQRGLKPSEATHLVSWCWENTRDAPSSEVHLRSWQQKLFEGAFRGWPRQAHYQCYRIVFDLQVQACQTLHDAFQSCLLYLRCLGLLWPTHAACLQIPTLTSKTRTVLDDFVAQINPFKLQNAADTLGPLADLTVVYPAFYRQLHRNSVWNSQVAPLFDLEFFAESAAVPRGLGLAAAEMDCIVQLCKGHTVEPAPALDGCNETDENCEKAESRQHQSQHRHFSSKESSPLGWGWGRLRHFSKASFIFSTTWAKVMWEEPLRPSTWCHRER